MSDETVADAHDVAWLSEIQIHSPVMLQVHLNIADREKRFGDISPYDLPAEIDEAVVIAMCPDKLGELARILFVTDEVRELLERAQLRSVDVAAALAALPQPQDQQADEDVPWGG